MCSQRCRPLYKKKVKDLFEGGIGKNNEDGKMLRKYLEGDGTKPSRFSLFASAIELQIKGPFLSGETMSYADFYLGHILEYYTATTLEKLQSKTGVNVFAPYPKISAIARSIAGLESKARIAAPLIRDTSVIKDAIVAAY